MTRRAEAKPSTRRVIPARMDLAVARPAHLHVMSLFKLKFDLSYEFHSKIGVTQNKDIIENFDFLK